MASKSGRMQQNMKTILKVLGEVPRNTSGDAYISGPQLQKKTGLSPADINDAVRLLKGEGKVELVTALGTAPYEFESVQITPEGRLQI